MKRIILALLILSLSQSAMGDGPTRYAVDAARSLSNDRKGHAEFDLYRFGLQWDLNRALWKSERMRLGGYLEASLSYWHAGSDDVIVASLSPMLVLMFGDEDAQYRPFLNGGIGLALLSDDEIAGRNLSTSWQFEDRIGFGVRSGDIGVHCGYTHYSNADLEKPNEGVDAWVIGLTFRF